MVGDVVGVNHNYLYQKTFTDKNRVEFMTEENLKLSAIERIKASSRYLRGTILEGLADRTSGALSSDDVQVLKFHGSYQQDDRDVRRERRRQKLEPAYQFMVRIRIPGGVCTPHQWLEMDRIAGEYANGSLRLTTRQSVQLHGVLKGDLRATLGGVNRALLSTLAACGDVNRNVMCNPNPNLSAVHGEALRVAQAISDHLSPRTAAYHEIWVTDGEGEKVKVTEEPEGEVEPIYGKTYMPRKFKIGVAVPPGNDIDVYSQDLGLVAITEGDRIVGFNVLAGGGMGMTHGNEKTYPRLGDVIGYCELDRVVDVAEKVVLVQRDFGDREDRKHARLKYTIDDRGVEWFRGELESRLGYELAEPRAFRFDHNGDRYGWVAGQNGFEHLTLFIQNGKVHDVAGLPLRTALREVAEVHQGDFRITPNQNLMIANVAEERKREIEGILERHGLGGTYEQTGLRLNSMACVALPTCGLALAESERYLPDLLGELEAVMRENGLERENITIRMTGCPNGCSRPYIGEIGLVGRAPGKYNIYLGGGFVGDRLNKLFKVSVKSEEIVEVLRPVIESFARERRENERFGDFAIRTGLVAETRSGREFHQGFKE